MSCLVIRPGFVEDWATGAGTDKTVELMKDLLVIISALCALGGDTKVESALSALQPAVFDSIDRLSSAKTKFFSENGELLSEVKDESLMKRLADSDVLKVICDKGQTCTAHIDDFVAKVVSKEPSAALKVPAIVKSRLPEKSSKFVMTVIALSKLPLSLIHI